jgi:large subunit ribosomal protein L9
MKVIFIKNQSGNGRLGEIKEVANGFAQNFLIPQKIALPATPKNIALVRQEKTQEIKAIREREVARSVLGRRLQGVSLNFSVKADEQGTLFASINRESLGKALAKQDFHLKPKQILLDEPIKRAGKYHVAIQVDNDTRVTIMVNVIEEK